MSWANVLWQGFAQRKSHQFHWPLHFALHLCFLDKTVPFSFWASVQGVFTDTFRLMMKCDQAGETDISLRDLCCAFAGMKHIGEQFATALLHSDSISNWLTGSYIKILLNPLAAAAAFFFFLPDDLLWCINGPSYKNSCLLVLSRIRKVKRLYLDTLSFWAPLKFKNNQFAFICIFQYQKLNSLFIRWIFKEGNQQDRQNRCPYEMIF